MGSSFSRRNGLTLLFLGAFVACVAALPTLDSRAAPWTAPSQRAALIPVSAFTYPNQALRVATTAVATAPVAVAEVGLRTSPAPSRFEDAIARAGQKLFAEARAQIGDEPRVLVIDPMVDANSGEQTVSTRAIGDQLQLSVSALYSAWRIKPFTRKWLAEQPLLLIGTLTPVNVEQAADTPADAYRVWLTLIDLRSRRVLAKQLDHVTVDSVNAEPMSFYRDSPSWHKDKTVSSYINSCQVNAKIGDPVESLYLMRLPAAAVVNEAIMAYDEGKFPLADKLFREAAPLADPDDLRVLNGLYLTSWKLGQREAAKEAFGMLVESGLTLKRLPLKLLFQPGRTTFNQIGDLPQQYSLWLTVLAKKASEVDSCIRIVGHTSRTGSSRSNESLSGRRAEAVQRLLEQHNPSLAKRLSSIGAGSREALVGLGTDDQRDALDRRVELRFVDCT